MSIDKPEAAEIQPGKFIVIAIGSSPDGLEVFRSLFRHLPVDPNVTCMIAPSSEDADTIAELLPQQTAPPVRQFDAALPLEPNCIYVAPPHTSVDSIISALSARTHARDVAVVFAGSPEQSTKTDSRDSRIRYLSNCGRPEIEIAERVSIERDLSGALAAKELSIAYQPQLCLRTNRTVGAESLLRWNTPATRDLPISTVISVAEESGLILTIGQWVLRESLLQLKQWLVQGHSLRVAVNLSAVQFHQQDVFGIVMELLTVLEIPPSSLKAEITETVLLNQSQRVKETLRALHGAGIGLVLDDFGTGYSSLTYLRQLPIESVKIDASFLKGIGHSRHDEAIVRGIIKLAHSLGLRVVAEGVETPLQLQFLDSCDCDYAQGYLFAKALPTADFDLYLAQAAAATN